MHVERSSPEQGPDDRLPAELGQARARLEALERERAELLHSALELAGSRAWRMSTRLSRLGRRLALRRTGERTALDTVIERLVNLDLRVGAPGPLALPPGHASTAEPRPMTAEVIVWGAQDTDEHDATIEHVMGGGVERVLAVPAPDDEHQPVAAAIDAALRASQAELVVLLRAGITVPRDWLTRLELAARSSPDAGLVATLSDAGALTVAIEERPPWLAPEAISLLAGRGFGERLRVSAFDASCFALTRRGLTTAGGLDPLTDDVQAAAVDFGERLREHGLECILADDVLVHETRATAAPQGRRRGRGRWAPANGERKEARAAVRSLLQLQGAIASVAEDPSRFADSIAAAGRRPLTVTWVVPPLRETSKAALAAACSDVAGLRRLGFRARLAAPADESERIMRRDDVDLVAYEDEEQLARLLSTSDVLATADTMALPLLTRVRPARADVVLACVLRSVPPEMPDTDLGGVMWLSASAWLSQRMFQRFGIRPGRFELSADSYYFHPRPDDAETHARLQVALCLRPATLGVTGQLLERLTASLGDELSIVTFGSSLSTLDRRGAPEGEWREHHLGTFDAAPLARLLGQTDIVLDPSQTLPTGELAAAAMACGAVPVFATGAEAAEIVRDERDGLLLDSEEPDAWYELVVALDQDWPRLRALQTAAVRAATRRSQLLTAITQYPQFQRGHEDVAARAGASAARPRPALQDGDKRVRNEHFVPDPDRTILDYLDEGDRGAVHHLIRYRWAEESLASLNASGRLLDLGCGAGYGAAGIAARLPELTVLGADYDADGIDFATAHYQAPNLSFTFADATRWEETLGDEQFDWIVCFDTLEHVSHREIVLQNIAEHLSQDGGLLLSTPVRGKTRLSPNWEHHKIEYGRRALYNFLRRYFEEVLAPDFGTLPCIDVFDEVNQSDPPLYRLRMNPVVCRGPITPRMPRQGRPSAARSRER